MRTPKQRVEFRVQKILQEVIALRYLNNIKLTEQECSHIRTTVTEALDKSLLMLYSSKSTFKLEN